MKKQDKEINIFSLYFASRKGQYSSDYSTGIDNSYQYTPKFFEDLIKK